MAEGLKKMETIRWNNKCMLILNKEDESDKKKKKEIYYFRIY